MKFNRLLRIVLGEEGERNIAKNGDYETVAGGSLGVRTGLHVAVPFHARFKDVEEALEYFKGHNIDSIDFLDVKVPIQWDTPSGTDLASSFVLSENDLNEEDDELKQVVSGDD
ncbi:hypothetical protein ANCDUO_05267 [Ancylostoma duodenale]|uniref:Uncharacterized protein n=1 Tax=Ancylostoma duodenale TaxID=51022 RepID=A0A0C2GT35_9BILA|nr:hypothetical protein ANCDUO_05267 [Ancylostoma duodenale]